MRSTHRIALTLCCLAIGGASLSADTPPSVPKARMLSAQEALDGWIALFDGRTGFGWKDGQLGVERMHATLHGGRTTTRFAQYVLAVCVEKPGTIRFGGTAERLGPGWTTLVCRSPQPAAIELDTELVVSSLLLWPTGLRPLFNGKDLRGWDRRERADLPPGREAKWTVESGAIRAQGGPGALEYAPPAASGLFGNFLLQVTVCTRRNDTNGGLFLRNEPGKTMMGYEAQLHNRWYDHSRGERGYTTGGIDDRQQARQAVARDHVPFRMTAVADGPHLATWVDGFQVTDWTDTRPPHANPRQGLRLEPGTLQLQAHDPETDMEFRGIWIQPW